MASSDDEYVQELSDGEGAVASGPSNGYGTRSAGHLRSKERWEDIHRSWDLVEEAADGSLAATVESLRDAGKRKRLLQDTTPVQRGIIRHLILILDLSNSMIEKDLKPSRYLLTLQLATTFIVSFFEQNPISQLGILGMRDGIALRISEVSGNPAEHIAALATLRAQEPKGNPSLQNALEMARAALFHTPTHGTREALIVFGALMSSDPGDIHKTITALVADKIRVSVVGLAARMAICAELCAKTHGTPAAENNPGIYGIALHEQHFRELLLFHVTPPVMRAADKSSAPSLMTMGFPSRVEEAAPTLCACHAIPSRGGYLCSRCRSKVCGLPAQCPTCDLQLVQSTHLARSYRHLFRLSNWEEVGWKEAARKGSLQCFACMAPFPPVLDETRNGGGAVNAAKRPGGGNTLKVPTMSSSSRVQPAGAGAAPKGVSESSRYKCTVCGEHFCVDCDVYAHEVLNCCGGCLSRPQQGGGGVDGAVATGNGEHGNGHVVANGSGHNHNGGGNADATTEAEAEAEAEGMDVDVG